MTDVGRLAGPERAPASGEHVISLADGVGFRVEQILSGRLSAPIDYVQDHDEWVVVIEGRAVLSVAGEERAMQAGDWILLPAGTPHTLVRTDPGTSWLAVRSVAPDG